MVDVKLDDILAIDGGQSYILSIYPELEPCFANKSKKVKLRDDDKTASTGVYKHRTTGVWMVHDFGGDPDLKATTAFKLCMMVNRCESSEAFKIIAKFYNIELKNSAPAKPTYSSRSVKEGEKPGEVLNLVYKDLEAHEAQLILSKNAWNSIEWAGKRAKTDEERLEFAQKLFQYYRLKSLQSYEQVKSDGSTVHIYNANESFPMFAFDEGTFQKIYKPKSEEKAYRFMYAGKKVDNFIHGIQQHKSVLEQNIKINADRLMNAESHSEAAAENEKAKESLPEKFQEIILVSGGSDAMNLAALGYKVIWMNSETAILDKDAISSIYKLCYDFYNLPDIDKTGRSAAKNLASIYLDIKTIWLPEELAQKSDGKGGKCKDLKDYLKHNNAESFKTLFKDALPFKFWDEMRLFTPSGDPRMRFGRPLYAYEFNNVRGYNFLQMNGFYRYENLKNKEKFDLIKIENNVVTVVQPNDVKDFIHSFLSERRASEDLRNAMYRSVQISENSLSNLKMKDPKFDYFGPDYQYLFFEKTTWKVTKNSIEATKSPDTYVWDYKILKPKELKTPGMEFMPKILSPFFSISENGNKWDLTFCPEEQMPDFMKFIIQTCRIHWKVELETRLELLENSTDATAHFAEYNIPQDQQKHIFSFNTIDSHLEYKKANQFKLDGSLLTDSEIQDQKLAFVNRIFLIGYMLHKYKDQTKTWAGVLMDYRVSEEGASNGRAGKGLFVKGLKAMLDYFHIDGRVPNFLADKHIFGGVNKGNDMIYIEDVGESFNFTELFAKITGSLEVNPKNQMKVTLEEEEFGKFIIDTNFADKYMDGSSKGRKLWSVFSDYYHEDLEHYREVRTPFTELGRRMYSNWDHAEWNQFYNFMAHCLQFYLTVSEQAVKIDPPFANILKRNNLAIMGENFRQWADTFFVDHLDEAIERKVAFENFMQTSNQTKFSSQSFFKKLAAWADFMGYVLNPQHIPGWTKSGDARKHGYIRRSVPAKEYGKHTTVEYIYIQTNQHVKPPSKDDLPF
ncbi:hypothetical protein HME7025_00068 [Aquirufa nivalisilvae]|uniref:Uncharacterized protein n=1 Tax=Aquirufa nivalisilvae TaxID=2516557 RepID=A0A2S2DRD5_9BACT|nr:hypothetical protein [Aquirufa nivalisilvae]AWL07953.1 hypothetical protein HME7025_00068 [Aquirufa nivalisilvae]